MPSNELRSDDEMLVVARRRAGEIRTRRTRGRLAGAAVAVVLVVATTAVIAGVRDRNADEQVFAIDPPVPTTVVEDNRPPGWSPMATSPLSGRAGSVSAWTGDEWLLWRGDGAFSDMCTVDAAGQTLCGEQAPADGAAYDPVADSWRMLPPAPVAADTGDQLTYEGVWTGSELVVWGGPEGAGAAYEPSTDSWREIAAAPLGARRGFVSAWTGSEMIVVGGQAQGLGTLPIDVGELGDGAAYDPATDQWRTIAAQGSAGSYGAAVWCAGSFVLLDDITDSSSPGSTAERFDPVSDAWTALPASPVEQVSGAVCADSSILAVGTAADRVTSAAAMLDLGSGSWKELTAPRMLDAVEPAVVWTGDQVVVAGSPMGDPAVVGFDVVALDLAAGTWTTLPDSGLSPRGAAAAIAVDGDVLLWGGAFYGGFTSEPVADGARYHPGSGSGGAVGPTPTNAPEPSGPGTSIVKVEVPTEPEEGDTATWDVDPIRPPSPTSSTFTAVVSRLGCNSGVTGTVLRPGVQITDTEVVVTFTVESDPDGGRCPSNDRVPYEVDLGQALGDRTLVDGSCIGGEAATTSFCSANGGGRFP